MNKIIKKIFSPRNLGAVIAILIVTGATALAQIPAYKSWLLQGANVFTLGTNLGIGTTTPAAKLDIVGDVRWTGSLTSGAVPWPRLTTFPAGCLSGQFITAVGSNLTCTTLIPTPSALNNNYLVKFAGAAVMASSSISDSAEMTNGKISFYTTVDDLFWVPGIPGGSAIDYDGQDDYVSVPDAASLNPTAAITLTAWIKPETLPYEFPVVLGKGSNDLGAGYELLLRLDSGFGFTSGGGGGNSIGGIIVLGQWQQIAVTYNGSALKFFYNGQLNTTINISNLNLVNSTHDLFIGRPSVGSLASRKFFDGVIDEVKVYNQALPDPQIQQEYLTPGSVSTGLVGYWRFNEGSGTAISDSSGMGNNGSLIHPFTPVRVESARIPSGSNGGDFAILRPGNGLILKATNGANCYRLTVNNTGALNTALVSCP